MYIFQHMLQHPRIASELNNVYACDFMRTNIKQRQTTKRLSNKCSICHVSSFHVFLDYSFSCLSFLVPHSSFRYFSLNLRSRSSPVLVRFSDLELLLAATNHSSKIQRCHTTPVFFFVHLPGTVKLMGFFFVVCAVKVLKHIICVRLRMDYGSCFFFSPL